jgi:hypothetical protein
MPTDLVAVDEVETAPVTIPEAKWPGVLDCAGHEVQVYFIDICIPQVVNKSIKSMKALSGSAFHRYLRAYACARDTGALTSENQIQSAVTDQLGK